MLTGRWQTNVLITFIVIFTVLIGLVLSQLDFLQPAIAVSDNPTVEADPDPTATQLTIVPIPTAVDTQSPTATQPAEIETPLSATSTKTPFAANTVTPIVDSSCEPSPLNGWVLYNVRPGDSLFSLARSRGTTVNAIISANCLVDLDLDVGDRIWLPANLVVTLTPTPSATLLPTVTITPTITPTTSPTVSVTVTTTNTPTMTPTPTETGVTPSPSPTSTVEPTSAPTTTSTPTETAAPTQSPTPEDTPIPEPTASQLPTSTPTLIPDE